MSRSSSAAVIPSEARNLALRRVELDPKVDQWLGERTRARFLAPLGMTMLSVNIGERGLRLK